jgi:hypothetical protein
MISFILGVLFTYLAVGAAFFVHHYRFETNIMPLDKKEKLNLLKTSVLWLPFILEIYIGDYI